MALFPRKLARIPARRFVAGVYGDAGLSTIDVTSAIHGLVSTKAASIGVQAQSFWKTAHSHAILAPKLTCD
jgi:hypothetical protein